MELFVPEIESKTDVSFLVIKAYILSLFFLVVVLFLAVGDAWTQYAEFYSLVAPSSSNFTYHYLDFSLTLWTLAIAVLCCWRKPRTGSTLLFVFFDMEPARQSKLSVFSRSLQSFLLPDFMKTLMVPLSCGLFNCSVSVDWYMITSMPGACPKDVQRRQEGFLSALPEVCTLQPPPAWDRTATRQFCQYMLQFFRAIAKVVCRFLWGWRGLFPWKVVLSLGFPNWNPKQQWSSTHNWGMGWHRLELSMQNREQYWIAMTCSNFFDPLR